MTPFTVTTTPERVQLTLTGDVTIEHAAPLHSALCATLTAERRLEFDASAATRIDAAILQLLIAAARAAAAANEPQPSTTWAATCTRFGVSSPFTPAPEPEQRHA